MLKIYFAHSREDYESKREKDALVQIWKFYPECRIFNPGERAYQKEWRRRADMYAPINVHMIPFFEVIDDQDILIFMLQESNLMGRGTWEEIMYAFRENKPVYLLNEKGFLQTIEKDDIIETHTKSGKADFRRNWAKVRGEKK